MSVYEMSCSVAMTTYNGSKYVLDQLRSIEAQTVKPDEVIVCDDVSSDDTVEIIQRYASSSQLSIRIYKNEKNLGYPKNFEKAISLCSGDIVFLCDQDDVWNSQKIQRMLAEFKRDENVVFLFSDARVVNGNLDVQAESLWKMGWSGSSHEWDKLDNQELFNLFISGNYPLGCLSAAKREFLHKILPFPTHHDRWIAYCAPAFGDIKAIGGPLIDYRRHGSNTTPTASLETVTSHGILKKILTVGKEVVQNDYENHFVYPTDEYKVCNVAMRHIKNTDTLIDSGCLEERLSYLKNISEVKNRGMIARLKTLRKLKKGGLYKRFRSESKNIYRIDCIFMILNSFKKR